MATVTLPDPVAAPTLLPPTPDGRVRFTRDAYRRMFEVGLFGVDPRVELLDGEILMMSPIGPFQGAIVRRLTGFFVKCLPDSIECSVQLPIIAGDHSEPEPDIALVRKRDDDYQLEHPAPADVVLLIEVAQSSIAYDLGRKLQIYAASAIPEYWVVDIGQKLVIVHREPAGSTFSNVHPYGPGSMIAPLAAPGCELDIAWLFR
jgi:Uma2 family endonuclease